jgi:phage FluMu protein Com
LERNVGGNTVHKLSIETLHHFSCHKCKKWWSIADWQPVKTIFCPHCGVLATVESIEEEDNE